MNCKEAKSFFDDRLDGRLDASRQAEFDVHLDGCPTCRQEWHLYAGAWTMLARQEVPAPSVGFAERTLRRLDEVPEVESVWSRWPVWRWALATGLAMSLSVGWFVWQHAQRARQTQVAKVNATDSKVEIYAMVGQDKLEDFDVVASLHLLNGGGQP